MAQTEIEAIFRPKSGQVAASDTRKRLLRRGRRADPSEKNPSGGGWGGNCTPGRANPAQMSALRLARSALIAASSLSRSLRVIAKNVRHRLMTSAVGRY